MIVPFSFVSLKKLIDSEKPSNSGIKHMLKNFRCKRDIDLQNYLNDASMALFDEKNNKNIQTFFIMDVKKTKIYLYVTVMLKPMSIIGISKEHRLNIFGDSRKSSAICTLISHLSKNDQEKDKRLTTPIIWDFIYKVLEKLSYKPDIIRIECRGTKLKKYYENVNDFFTIGRDKTNNLEILIKKYVTPTNT